MRLPGSFRFFTQLQSPLATACAYEVYFVDPNNLQTLVFAYTAKAALEMVELELGPVATYATVWGANVKRESCPGACPARTQNIYKRDVLLNDLTWFYPLPTETLSPFHNNLV